MFFLLLLLLLYIFSASASSASASSASASSASLFSASASSVYGVLSLWFVSSSADVVTHASPLVSSCSSALAPRRSTCCSSACSRCARRSTTLAARTTSTRARCLRSRSFRSSTDCSRRGPVEWEGWSGQTTVVGRRRAREDVDDRGDAGTPCRPLWRARASAERLARVARLEWNTTSPTRLTTHRTSPLSSWRGSVRRGGGGVSCVLCRASRSCCSTSARAR